LIPGLAGGLAPRFRSFPVTHDNTADTKDRPVDPSETIADDADPHVDKQLDKGLKETFPASDPVSINPGAD